MFKSVLRTKTTKQCAYFDTSNEAVMFLNSFINGCQEKQAKEVNDKMPYGIIFQNGECIKINFYQN